MFSFKIYTPHIHHTLRSLQHVYEIKYFVNSFYFSTICGETKQCVLIILESKSNTSSELISALTIIQENIMNVYLETFDAVAHNKKTLR